MTREQRLVFLKDEYLKLQDYYEDYDRRSLTIKGWIAAGAAAGIAIGLDPEKNGGGMVWIFIALIAACFWYLETYWKTFQYALADRIRIIEAYFRNDKTSLFPDPDPLQIYAWWFRSFVKDEPIYEHERKFRPTSRSRRLFYAAFQPFVMLPYVLIIVICFVGFALQKHLVL